MGFDTNENNLFLESEINIDLDSDLIEIFFSGWLAEMHTNLDS